MMDEINLFMERIISLTGLTGDYVPVVRYAFWVVLAFILAWLAGKLCRMWIVPLMMKITSKTDAKWDDVIFSERVRASSQPLSSGRCCLWCSSNIRRWLMWLGA